MRAAGRRAVVVGLAILAAGAERASGQAPDWTAVERALGRTGQVQPGDVYRVAMPRTDLTVTVRGITIRLEQQP